LVGEILAGSATADVVDGHLGFIVRTGDTVVTSDVADIRRILSARKTDATVHHA